MLLFPARPEIGYMNPVVSVIQGEDLELNCLATAGNPKPKVLWLQHGQVLRPDKHIQRNSNGNLIIKDVQSFHGGDYICLATNIGGNESYIVSVAVQGNVQKYCMYFIKGDSFGNILWLSEYFNSFPNMDYL